MGYRLDQIAEVDPTLTEQFRDAERKLETVGKMLTGRQSKRLRVRGLCQSKRQVERPLDTVINARKMPIRELRIISLMAHSLQFKLKNKAGTSIKL